MAWLTCLSHKQGFLERTKRKLRLLASGRSKELPRLWADFDPLQKVNSSLQYKRIQMKDIPKRPKGQKGKWSNKLSRAKSTCCIKNGQRSKRLGRSLQPSPWLKPAMASNTSSSVVHTTSAVSEKNKKEGATSRLFVASERVDWTGSGLFFATTKMVQPPEVTQVQGVGIELLFRLECRSPNWIFRPRLCLLCC